VRLFQSLCAVRGSNLAGLTLLYIVLPCVVAVVPRPAWRMLYTVLIAWFDVNPNKRRLLLLLFKCKKISSHPRSYEEIC